MSKESGKKNLYLSPIITEQRLTFLDHMTLEPLSELKVGELAGRLVYGSEGRYVIVIGV